MKSNNPLANEAAEEAAQQESLSDAVSTAKPLSSGTAYAASDIKKDSVTFSLAKGEAAEFKVGLSKGQKVSYNWQSTAKTNFDYHGDSKPLKIKYHNYKKGSEISDQGEIEAAFEGYHGWFWRNRNENPVTITLNVEGAYTEFKKVD